LHEKQQKLVVGKKDKSGDEKRMRGEDEEKQRRR